MSQNESIICPQCGSTSPKIKSVYRETDLSFTSNDPIKTANINMENVDQYEDVRDALLICFFRCPSCEKHTIKIKGIGSEVKDKLLNFYPSSNAKVFPTYIPESIRKDYEEACQIVNLSPKASATLSRRCLQGMIRDYWKVTNKKNLYEEITAIQDKVSPEVARVLKGLKDLGNIGAHMEKDINLIIDIDSGEAEKLIKLIEYLMKEWYINRYESEQLFNDIIGIDEAKKEQKRNGKSQ